MDIAKARTILDKLPREQLVRYCELHRFPLSGAMSVADIVELMISKDPAMAMAAAGHFTRLEFEAGQAGFLKEVEEAHARHLREVEKLRDEVARQISEAKSAVDVTALEVEKKANTISLQADQSVKAAESANKSFERFSFLVKIAVAIVGLPFAILTSMGIKDIASIQDLKENARTNIEVFKTNTVSVAKGLGTFEVLKLVESSQSIVEKITSSINQPLRKQLDADIPVNLRRLRLMEQTFWTTPEARISARADLFMITNLNEFYAVTINVLKILSSPPNSPEIKGISNVLAQLNPAETTPIVLESVGIDSANNSLYVPAVHRLNACRLNMMGLLLLRQYKETPPSEENERKRVLALAEEEYQKAIDEDFAFARPYNGLGVIALSRLQTLLKQEPLDMDKVSESEKKAKDYFEKARLYTTDPQTLSFIYNNLAVLNYSIVTEVETNQDAKNIRLIAAGDFLDKAKYLPFAPPEVFLSIIELKCVNFEMTKRADKKIDFSSEATNIWNSYLQWHAEYGLSKNIQYFTNDSPFRFLIKPDNTILKDIKDLIKSEQHEDNPRK